MDISNRMYVCDCGKEYQNGTALGNHKRICPTYHINTYGTLDRLNEYLNKREKSKLEYKQNKLQKWLSENHTCKRCGKIMTEYFGSGTYCSKYCANSREHSVESKMKVSESLKRTFREKRATLGIIKVVKHCSICGNIVDSTNTSGYCGSCINYSPVLLDYRRERGKHANLFVKNHVPWRSRNVMPYSEVFWKQVLDSNNIEYKHDFTIYVDNKHWYYADFYIEKNGKKLDLEIDGKQHNYPDRKQHDILRDEYLTNRGYIVYRIKWNEINSDSGKSEMKDKIDKFLAFYCSL